MSPSPVRLTVACQPSSVRVQAHVVTPSGVSCRSGCPSRSFTSRVTRATPPWVTVVVVSRPRDENRPVPSNRRRLRRTHARVTQVRARGYTTPFTAREPCEPQLSRQSDYDSHAMAVEIASSKQVVNSAKEPAQSRLRLL